MAKKLRGLVFFITISVLISQIYALQYILLQNKVQHEENTQSIQIIMRLKNIAQKLIAIAHKIQNDMLYEVTGDIKFKPIDHDKLANKFRLNAALKNHGAKLITKLPKNGLDVALISKQVPKNRYPNLQYDYKTNSLFRPLLVKKKQNEAIKGSQKQNLYLKNLIDDIQNLLITNSLREKEPPKTKTEETQEKYLENDEGAVSPENNDVQNQTLSKPTQWHDPYDFWDFWTYKKPLVSDDCPINQVKYNNICIYMPPH